jgi:radical SAM superfamily enzyme YgiQ (UPF0313 family)
MVRVLLVSPMNNPMAENHSLGLLSIGTYLKQNGHDVFIFDSNLGHNHEVVTSGFKPDVVGISLLTPFANNGYNYSGYFRSKGLPVIVGGPHVTAVPQESMRFADVVITGEGEKSFLNIVNKNDFSHRIIPGDRLTNLDDIKMFDYSIMSGFDHYANIRKSVFNSMWAYALPMDKVMAIVGSRGCPWRCIYCHNTYTNIPLRFRSPELIVEEIKYLVSRGINAIAFVDDDFLINKKWAEDICNRIHDEHINVYLSINARANDITEDTCEFLTRGHVLQIAFGFESAVQRILDILDKGTTVEQNKNAIDICNKYGIIIQGSFMFGNPTETMDDMEKTYEFMTTNFMAGGLGTFITTPMPSTRLWDWCIANGKLSGTNHDWSNYMFHKQDINIPDVPRDIFLTFMSNALQNNEVLFRSREQYRIDRTLKFKKKLELN